MITLDQATELFREIVKKSEKKYMIETVWEISLDDPIYAMIAVDENGDQVFPGEVFPSIRKADGSLIDFSFPTTG